MNIFLILLVSLFMVGYYMFFGPNTRVPEHETDFAIEQSDLRSVAECAVAVHNSRINNYVFEDVCVEQNQIKTENICLDTTLKSISCEIVRGRKPDFSFIVTTTGTLHPGDYNEMMEIIEKEFPGAGTFGIYQDGIVLSGGTSIKRKVPDEIIQKMKLEDGQLIYITQYDIPDVDTEFKEPGADDIVCPFGTSKIYRFGRWQCVQYNMKTSCGGDKIWDSDLMECVPDELRKPLCASKQTAVMVDDVWECVDPFNDRTCQNGYVARLNYDKLEWECVEDPSATKSTSKCDFSKKRVVRGRGGATVRVSSNSCTDCEKLVVNEETCEAFCVPDVTKISSPSCYPGNPNECRGASRAIYFGFPNAQYVKNIVELANADVPFDSKHSQNRKFNCMDCGTGIINSLKSVYPYTAVCVGDRQ